MKLILFLLSTYVCYAQNTTEFTEVLCDFENSTCMSITTEPDENITSTEEYNTTEISVLNDTFNFTIFGNRPKFIPEIHYNSYDNYNVDYCLCDLQQNYCNFDCCCDPDCNHSQKLLFSKCETEIYHDSDFCYTSETIYVNMTKVYWENPENRLFCIVKTNLPRKHETNNKKLIISVKNAEYIIQKQHKWPKLLQFPKLQIDTNKFDLNYGSNLWLYKNQEFTELRLPINFISNKCVKETNIQFRKDFSSICAQNIIDESNNNLNPEYYFQNVTFIFLTKFSNISFQDININDCPKNICAPINCFICDENFFNCSQISNETNIKLNCYFNVLTNEQTCYSVATKIKYEIYHNTTHGLTEINLFLNLVNLTYFLTDKIEVIQTYEVKFYWQNYKRNLTEIFSGNPGYLLGSAILFGTLNETKTNITNNKLYDTLKISIHHFNILENHFVFPKNIHGFCTLNNNTYQEIEFGYNMRLNCMQTFTNNSTKNATHMCLKMQENIYKSWRINIKNNTKQYVGMFGNANRLEISEWIQILYKFDPSKALDKINGEFKFNELFCYNLIQTLRVNIIYAKIDFEFSKKQAKILNVFYEVDESRKTELIRGFNENDYIIETFVEIMFFDVTNDKIRKFTMHDFFYPFNMNKQNIYMFNYLLMISLCIFTLIL